MQRKTSKQITIGVLTDHIEGNYQSSFWPGLLNAAKKNHINLIFFAGLFPDDKYESKKNHNIIFELATNRSLDGLLVVTSVLKSYFSQDKLARFLKKFDGLPVTSISKANDHIPYVDIDYSSGLYDVIDHLIDFHKYKKIAFICGTDTNPDANLRLEIYKNALEKHTIPYNEDLVIPGDFNIISGKNGVDTLLLERKQQVDAIVAASDDIAIGAIYRLKELNIAVPDEIAVTGLDDVEDVKLFHPPLTTVHLPLYQQCETALNMLLELINTGSCQDNIFLQSKMIVRQSCGCYPHALSQYCTLGCDDIDPTEKNHSLTKNKQTVFDAFQNSIYTIISREIPDRNHPVFQWVDRLLDYLFSGPDTDYNKEAFIKIILQLPLEETLKFSNEIFLFDVLKFIQKKTLNEIPLNIEKKHRIELYFLESFVLIAEKIVRPDALIYSKEVEELFSMRVISQHILSTLNLDDLKKIILSKLPATGVNSCHIVLFNGKAVKTDDLTWEVPLKSKLILSVSHGSNLMDNNTSITFKTKDILPETYLQKGQNQYMIAMPLYFQQEQFGYILQEFSSTNYYVYENLRNLVCSSLKGASLLENEKLIVKSLHIAKQQLEESNISLRKLDTLKNEFITNITHDFRSPLMVIHNTAELGYKYENDHSEKKIKKRYKTILMAASKLTATIDRLLDISRMDAKGLIIEVYKVDIKQFLTQVVNAYITMTLSINIEIITDFPQHEVDNFFSNTEKLEEIIMNVLSNTIKYGNPDNGKVSITLTDKAESIEIRIKDNGIGIPIEKLQSIFNRYEQLNIDRKPQYKGSGIGLAYAKQLCEYLNGSIRAESDGIGHGACFIITFPKGTEVYINNPNIEIVSDSKKESNISNKILLEIQSKVDVKFDEEAPESEVNLIDLYDLNKAGECDYKKAVFLIISENKLSCTIIMNYLKSSGFVNFIQARDKYKGLDAVYKYRPDLIIYDYDKSNIYDDELYSQLEGHPVFNKTPFILLTALYKTGLLKGRKQQKEIPLLHKPVIEEELINIVKNTLKYYSEQKKLLELIDTDLLTSLYNKRFLDTQLSILANRKIPNQLSLLLIEIDHLKDINTTYGYFLGDQVLIKLGNAIHKTLNTCDIIGRYSAKQFLVILDGSDKDESFRTADTIMESIRQLEIQHENTDIKITASIGLVSLYENEKYISETLNVSGIKEIYTVTTSGETAWNSINEKKEQLAQLLINMANTALLYARSTTCNACRFKSTNATKFKNSACPRCNSTDISTGHNRTVSFQESYCIQ